MASYSLLKKLSMATAGAAFIFLGAAFANASAAKAEQSTVLNPVNGDKLTDNPVYNNQSAPSLRAVEPLSGPKVAVFGNNSIDDFLNTQPGFSATLVTDAELASAGFLNAFDVFLYTRDGASFGTGLSPAAATNVKSFVTGNVVLFMTDLADKIGSKAFEGEDTLAKKALLNAVIFAATNGKGYVGEFNGAGLALSSNTSGKFGGQALELVPGTFTSVDYNPTQPFDIRQTDSPVAAGLPQPWASTGSQDYLAGSIGIPSQYIVAEGPAGGSNRFATIVAKPVPEPASTLGFLSFGTFSAGFLWKGRKRKQEKKALNNNHN